MKYPSSRNELISHVKEVRTEIDHFQLVIAIVESVVSDDIHCKCAVAMMQINWLSFRYGFLDPTDEPFGFGLNDFFEAQYSLARKDRVGNCAADTMQFITRSYKSGRPQSKGVVEICSFGWSF